MARETARETIEQLTVKGVDAQTWRHMKGYASVNGMSVAEAVEMAFQFFLAAQKPHEWTVTPQEGVVANETIIVGPETEQTLREG